MLFIRDYLMPFPKLTKEEKERLTEGQKEIVGTVKKMEAPRVVLPIRDCMCTANLFTPCPVCQKKKQQRDDAEKMMESVIADMHRKANIYGSHCKGIELRIIKPSCTTKSESVKVSFTMKKNFTEAKQTEKDNA